MARPVEIDEEQDQPVGRARAESGRIGRTGRDQQRPRVVDQIHGPYGDTHGDEDDHRQCGPLIDRLLGVDECLRVHKATAEPAA